MLSELHSDLVRSANRIPNWQKMYKIDIAKKYVENEHNETLRESYYSAFALRYWYQVPVIYKKSHYLVRNLHLTIEDVSCWYFEALDKVFKNRAFMNPEVYTYEDKNNPDKFINGYVYKAIETTRLTYYNVYNYDKYKSSLYTTNIEDYVEEHGDIADNSNKISTMMIDKLIEKYIDKNLYFEAYIIYCILYGECFTLDQKANNVFEWNYSKVKTLNTLKNLQDEDLEDFIERYAKGKDIRDDLMAYKYYSRQWIYFLYNSVIEKLKNDEDLKLICFK